jgi:protein phosphatase
MKLLILSDIHGNWPALEAVLQAEPRYDAVAFCGDVVDYGPSPVGCLRWVASNANYSVRGNHDNALGFDTDCRCMGSFRAYALATRAWHRTLLSDTDRLFLRQLPVVNDFGWQGKSFRMAHATPQGDLFEYLALDQWGERVKDLDADFVLLGHTHVQGSRTFGKLTVVNPGSVGLARDRAGEACYAVYDGDRLELRRIPYDVSRMVAALRRAPLPEQVVEGLAAAFGGRRRGSG